MRASTGTISFWNNPDTRANVATSGDTGEGAFAKPPRICVKRGVENQIDSPEPGAQVRLTRMRKAIHLLPGSRCDLLGCVNGGHSRFSYFRNRQVS